MNLNGSIPESSKVASSTSIYKMDEKIAHKENLNQEQIKNIITDYNSNLQSKKNNIWGVLSFICGITSYLLFSPLGFVAILLGIVSLNTFDEYKEKNKWFRYIRNYTR